MGAWHLALRLALAVWGEEASNTLIYLANLAFCLDKLGRSTEALPLHQHALDLLKMVLGKRHPETLSSLHNQALCLMSLGRAAEALPLLEQALAGRREVLGERHPDTLTILNNQAACLRDLNQTVEVLSLDQQALALRREVLGERHPDTLISLSNVALCFVMLGRVVEALPLLEQALLGRREVLGERHPKTLKSLADLAVCFYALSRWKEALPLLEKALALHREVLGDTDPSTLGDLSSLSAMCLDHLGRAEEALPLHQQALALAREVLGEHHPIIRNNFKNLADFFCSLDRWEEALPLLQRSLELNRQILGERHQNTLKNLNDLVVCLWKLGRTVEALALGEQALALHREVLGDTNPITITALNNLSTCLADLGLLQEAMPIYQQSLKLSRKVRGKEHKNTLIVLDNLGSCLLDLERAQEALPLFQQALALAREVLSEHHPQIVLILNNLACCLRKLGRAAEALPLHEQSLALAREVLGERYSDTLTSLQNVANCLVELSRPAEALPLYRQALAGCREMLGERHPNTLISFGNLAVCLDTLGRSAEALAVWRELANRLANRPLLAREWPALVWSAAYTLAEAVLTDPAVEWAGPFQALSRAWVEVLDLQPPEQVAVLREPFQRFHRLYFTLCLNQYRVDLLPSLLAALQGRQLAALLLEELTQALAAEVAADAPLRQRVLALRRQLRQAALGLQVLEGGRGRLGEDGPQRSSTIDPAKVEAQWAAARQPRAEYDKLYRQYHDLLGRLRQEDPDFAMAAPALDVDLPTLQGGLAAEEALALLLHVRSVGGTDEAAFVLLITAHGKPFCLLRSPAELLPLPGHAWRRQEAISDRAGLRYTSTAGADATAPDAAPASGDGPASPADWVAAMNRHFWQPLAPALSGIRTVHLVSHGDFHVLPYAAGGPPDLTVYTYPGLLFYYQHRHLAPRSSDSLALYPSTTAPLGLHGYDAADHPDLSAIPLVGAETRLIAALWPEAVRTPLTLPPADPVTFLHCAGHGQHPTADPLGAGLVLGPTTQLDCRALFRSPLRPQVVFLSACVVGRTSEDRDGEPLGLVSAFLLRGATYVVAPLQPVSDCLMPLLAGLFHQAWRAGLAPPQALLEAKRRLAEGDWYPDTADRVRAAYAATLAAYLPALLAEPDRKRQRQGLSALRRWPLPPAYAQAGEAGLRAQLASERGRQGFIAALLAHLEQNRRALPVAELLPWVVGFGGPAG